MNSASSSNAAAVHFLVHLRMPNSSLDRHLFGTNQGVLSWETRNQIALGVARDLDYLHEKCWDCIIHCDIKPENILLDDAFAPKVADFGLSPSSSAATDHAMRGTVGYLAPEWIEGTAITTKADVFSYGMMLIKLISGTMIRNLTRNNARLFLETNWSPCLIRLLLFFM
ncbi:hypothetical protein EJB05_33161, partial [Eragrostis curvula]